MKFYGWEICCPRCRGELADRRAGDGGHLACEDCGREWPVIAGIPDLRVFDDPYIAIEADRAKGRTLAERFDDLDFDGLVDFYYSITAVVPPKHARQYKRGLMTGVARAEAALTSWESRADLNGPPTAASLLEIGCGTAPLLVAAAPWCAKLVGVDIAFRWLIVAKKRLAEAGLRIPLICACAEALPFPNGVFDRIVADSVIEHLQDQKQALRECHRVMRVPGYIFVSSPNRYSLGPDPHTGLWAGGFLPNGWVAAYVRRQGGIPPKRQLLSVRSLNKLIRTAGFSPPRVFLPDVPAEQRNYFGSGTKLLIDLYHLAKRLPPGKQLLRWIGPLLHAVGEKRELHAPRDNRAAKS